MWTAIVAFLPFVQQIINWWNARKQAQTDAATAEGTAEAQHQNDGAQSVADRDSADRQNSSLDEAQKKIENPIPIVISGSPPPGVKK